MNYIIACLDSHIINLDFFNKLELFFVMGLLSFYSND
jgi:hypothetical protein